MIPFLQQQFIATLAQQKFVNHSNHSHSSTNHSVGNLAVEHSFSKKNLSSSKKTVAVSLKNQRRINRLREQKLADKKIHELESALQVEKATKEDLRDQLSTLQTHVVAYKQRFEESLAHAAQQKKQQLSEQKRQEQNQVLDELSSQLHTVESSTESLFFEKKLSFSMRKEILSLVTALNKAIEEKKNALE